MRFPELSIDYDVNIDRWSRQLAKAYTRSWEQLRWKKIYEADYLGVPFYDERLRYKKKILKRERDAASDEDKVQLEKKI